MPYPFNWEQWIDLFRFNEYDPLLFGSGFFLFFLFGILILYRLFNNNSPFQIYLLIFASAFFYYKAAGGMLILLFTITLINFYAGKFLYSKPDPKTRFRILSATLFLNLALLGYFKYTNFFLSTLNDLGLSNFSMLNILLPIGISFYTLKAMSYVIEIYYEMMKPVNSLRDFTLFTFFFPNILMGPIERAQNFIPQIKEKLNLSPAILALVIFLLSTGLFKKYVIADYIGLNFTDRVFEFPLRFTGVENLMAVYASAIQSYCDFSGYTDMALGVALLFGFRMVDNFNRPYKATSIGNFWQRWHLSLSTYLLDYLFKPLQIKFRRKRKYGTAIAILITFFVVGLWHGPRWTFILFGLLHSFYLIFSLFTQKPRNNFYHKLGIKDKWWFVSLQWLFTFHILVFTALLFRAPSLEYAYDMLSQILFYFHGNVFFQFAENYPYIIFLVLFGYIIHFLPQSLETKTIRALEKTPLPAQALLFSLMIWLIAQAKSTELVRFIYFQF